MNSMTALSCRRRRLLNAARRIERRAADENPMWRSLARKAADRLRKEAARL